MKFSNDWTVRDRGQGLRNMQFGRFFLFCFFLTVRGNMAIVVNKERKR
jgi:hypothetical protein